jgi:hypothetical protein
MDENVNSELASMYDADQQDRPNYLDAEVQNRDRQRRTRAKLFYEEGLIKSPEGLYHASMIFQHGETPDDWKLANDLAKKSMDLGYEDAKWLYAASHDRLLSFTNRTQKYGTQYEVLDDGSWILSPYDQTTTDEERARYNVPPLKQLKERARLNTERVKRGEAPE